MKEDAGRSARACIVDLFFPGVKSFPTTTLPFASATLPITSVVEICPALGLSVSLFLWCDKERLINYCRIVELSSVGGKGKLTWGAPYLAKNSSQFFLQVPSWCAVTERHNKVDEKTNCCGCRDGVMRW